MNRKDIEDAGLRGREVVAHILGPQCRMVNSVWLVADPDDKGFMPHAMNDGYWEAWVTAWFLGQLTQRTLVIDVGANQGYYGLLAASRGCDTLALEPQPRLYERLRASQDVNGFHDDLYLPVRVAVGATDGTATFYVPPGHGMNASFTPSYSPNGPVDSYTVKVETLDQIVYDFIGFATQQPLLIKVDVEGAEEAFWEGAQQTWQTYAGLCTVLLEFRWDRYQNPLAFAKRLFADASVAHVDYSGYEVPLRFAEQLQQREHEDWMLVLRRKG